MKNANDILAQLTLAEKAALCSGQSFWDLQSVERLGLDAVMVTDGPHGLRKQEEGADHLGFQKSVPATCFPTAATLANSWNKKLLEQVGQLLGEECLQENVAVLLGPGINIKRSPLCGRNFEYFSEDPYLTGELSAHYINGVQAKGIGTSLKHFALNNQEKLRMTNDSVADTRAIREIYISAFERAVKKAQPWTVMCSYNRADGVYLSENKQYLTDILRDEWNFEGAVVSDWGAVNNRVDGIKAGMDIEMPAIFGLRDEQIIQAVENGELPQEQLDTVVLRIIKLILRSMENRQPTFRYSKEEHHQKARQAAAESIVLLKNEDKILPLSKKESVVLIGQFAKKPRYQGAGSSHVTVTKLDSLYDIFTQENIDFQYCEGFSVENDTTEEQLLAQAVALAKTGEKVIICAGLIESYESEGYDRAHLEMPKNQLDVINAVAAVNPNVVVVLCGGAPFVMPWLPKVKGCLHGYLGGQAGAGAMLDVIYGTENPSGKLAESYPLSLKDTPCFYYYGANDETAEYRESIYVGYRYYDTANVPVLFPFGYGLSYTTFAYSGLALSQNTFTGKGELQATVTVTNTGNRAGAEIVQLYVAPQNPVIFKAKKELKGFEKVFLQPGEAKTISFTLDSRSFAHYSVSNSGWEIESGEYEILIGASSADIQLRQTIFVEGNAALAEENSRQTHAAYYHLQPGREISRQEFEALLGRKITSRTNQEKYNKNSTLQEISAHPVGQQIHANVLENALKAFGASDVSSGGYQLVSHMVDECPLRNLVLFSGGTVTFEQVDQYVAMLNQG